MYTSVWNQSMCIGKEKKTEYMFCRIPFLIGKANCQETAQKWPVFENLEDHKVYVYMWIHALKLENYYLYKFC